MKYSVATPKAAPATQNMKKNMKKYEKNMKKIGVYTCRSGLLQKI